MRLTYPQPPPEILQLAYGAMNMEMLRHPHSERPPSLTSRSNAYAHVPDAYQVYLLTAADIAKRRDLRAAQHTSWQDVVVLSGIGHGIEVAMSASRPTKHVVRGNAIDHQLSVLTELAGEPGNGTFEVRGLRIPLLVPFSFWLKAANDRNSRLVPVASNVPQLQPGKQYKAKEFFDALRKTAAHLITTDLARPADDSGAPRKPAGRKKRPAVKPALER